MSIDFILITIIFIILIIISYFLKSIRYSYPLLVIYFFYIINTIFNNNQNTVAIANFEDSSKPFVQEKNEILNLNDDASFSNNTSSDIINKDDNKNKTIKTLNKNKVIIANSKPVVSKNPKPIFIDTNMIDNSSIPIKIINNNDDNTNDIKSDDEIKTKKLKLNEIMICRDIYKRNPVKPGNDFINTVDTLFCYTKISNSGLKKQVKHVWFYENKEVTTVRYNIKPSFNYRSWSRKKIMKNQIGKWRVDVIDGNDELLGSVNFNVNSINSTF